MTTQRDRLAAVVRAVHATIITGLHDIEIGGSFSASITTPEETADALLARGVRVVDADTLGMALQDHVCEQEPSDWGAFDKCGMECSRSIMEALDDEP